MKSKQRVTSRRAFFSSADTRQSNTPTPTFVGAAIPSPEAQKRVTWDTICRVILIPTCAEYAQYKISGNVWYTRQERQTIKAEASQEIQTLAETMGITPQEAQKILYAGASEDGLDEVNTQMESLSCNP